MTRHTGRPETKGKISPNVPMSALTFHAARNIIFKLSLGYKMGVLSGHTYKKFATQNNFYFMQLFDPRPHSAHISHFF